MPFACVVRVKLSAPHREFAIDAPAAEFPYRGHRVTMKGHGTTLRSSRDVLFVLEGCRSESEALGLGIDLRGHLRLVGMHLRMSFDVGASQSVEDRAASTTLPNGAQVIAPVDGVTVYEQSGDDALLTPGSLGIRMSTPLALFTNAVLGMTDFRPASADDDARTLACDLVQAADADPATRSRFVTVVTALECLTSDASISESGQSIVDSLITQFNALAALSPNLDPGERDSLRGRIKELKRRSIRRGVRTLVQQLGPDEVDGLPSGQFVDRCYACRSALVHGQLPPPSDRDLGTLFEPLRNLAEYVILRYPPPSQLDTAFEGEGVD